MKLFFIYKSCGVLLKIMNEIMNIGIFPLVLKLFEQFKTSPRNIFFLSCYIKQNPKKIYWLYRSNQLSRSQEFRQQFHFYHINLGLKSQLVFSLGAILSSKLNVKH
jgi:hypothetical protein